MSREKTSEIISSIQEFEKRYLVRPLKRKTQLDNGKAFTISQNLVKDALTKVVIHPKHD